MGKLGGLKTKELYGVKYLRNLRKSKKNLTQEQAKNQGFTQDNTKTSLTDPLV